MFKAGNPRRRFGRFDGVGVQLLEGRVLLSVTPSLVANRVSGVAPLSVHFDATGTTSTATALPFHEIQYVWDFGDVSSGTWDISGKSRNQASGAVAGHVFDQAGTYTVTLNVRDPDGSIGTQGVTIQVQDPEVVFAGTNTIVFSTTGDFTGAPAGALQVTTSSLVTIASYAAPGKRLLLHRGETWNNTAAITINKLGPGIVGAYGSGAKPTITSTASNLFTISARAPSMDDWRFMDLNLTGAEDKIAFLFNGTADHILIDRVDMANFGGGVTAGPSILDYWNNTGSPQTLYDGNAVVNSTITNGLGGGGNNGMFIAGQRLMLLGNSITGMDQVEHVLRTPWLEKTIISDNLLSTPASAKHNLKLHAPQFEVAGLGFHHYSEQIVVSNNVLEGALNPWIITIGPQDNVQDNRVRDVLFEKNLIKAGSGTQVGLLLSAERVTVQNNIYSLSNGDIAIKLQRRGIEPAPNDNRIYNNTVYPSSGIANGVVINAEVTNTTVKNNLLAIGGTVVSNAGSGTILANNLKLSSPGFVSSTPVNPSDFALRFDSPARDAGTPVPFWNDFGGNSRPAGSAYDVGAWERPLAAVAGRWIFYNNSYFDGSDPAANALDDSAIATDKTALLPGQAATFDNYTSYSRGINGLMLDILGLPEAGPTAGDFEFRVGNDSLTPDPLTWAVAAAPLSVSIRRGAGAGGSDRVELLWADNAIQKQWLRVKLLANANSGLAADDVFYFGNAVGETGNSTTSARMDSSDEIGARQHPKTPSNPALITDLYDFNRDHLVNSVDQLIARNNKTIPSTELKLIQTPA